MIKMSMQVKPVNPRRLSASKVANDNEKTLWSKLTWGEQTSIQKRIGDLQWQLNYATIQLKNWQDLDNGAWEPLESMRDRAQAELNGLMFG